MNHLYSEMPNELSLDYICYLEQKWKNYLRKYDPWDYRKVRLEQDVRDTLDDMKNETKVGIMLYGFFAGLHSKAEGELQAYKRFLLIR